MDGPNARSLTGYRLVVLGDRDVVVHPLPARGRVVIGRGEDADLRVDRPALSRRHAEIRIEGDRLELRDLGSSNGTQLGGTKIASNTVVRLAPGDIVELGATSILVQGPAAADRARATAPTDALAERVAKADLSVLLVGETGVGKDVMARRIHAMSPRASGPFVAINCGALSEELLASELFGHEAGAFTGATTRKQGQLETAEGGTVFLDEIGEMPPSQQVKLLRVLEERRVMPVGGVRSKAIDVRLLAATHRDLPSEVTAGRFREDLYYRINGITLSIAPLRERTDEIEALARTFATEAARRAGTTVPSLRPEALAALQAHRWPGNIRELKNVIERAVVLCGDEPIGVPHLGLTAAARPTSATSTVTGDDDVGSDDERARILAALAECAGNQTRAADLLGISRKTLGKKMDRYAIARPQKSRG